MRATVLKTNRGTRLFWTFQDSNGNLFDAEGCYQYCQEEEAKGRIQARKLIQLSQKIHDHSESEYWYLERNHFLDLDIPEPNGWNIVLVRTVDYTWQHLPHEPKQSGIYVCTCILTLHDAETRYLQVMQYDAEKKYWHDPGKEHATSHRVIAWKKQDVCREEIYA